MGLRGFLAELRRRGVYKTAGVYAAIAWLLLEVLSVVFQNFGAPARLPGRVRDGLGL